LPTSQCPVRLPENETDRRPGLSWESEKDSYFTLVGMGQLLYQTLLDGGDASLHLKQM